MEPVFVTYNKIFDFEFVEKLFKNKEKGGKLKKNQNFNSELDSKNGLHDYNVYFCIRNQTKTIFLSHSQLVYNADFKKS